ncbi:MAG: imidazole glycerol phosphate synthase subunit HisH [Desulfobacula sp.]|uniref:imidazole glycerol phosphate synthase subunit HisH n=1 Tax=Desulfobacula sp. TaxID=2593537 RepID=UPI0025C024FF|nr:imidazole glycerol phosphate synthase subunit HisH [Desulfobacula sp.]MCD4722142.1 imidazole glycerol phosphate synthase subunit HisH [Desulfobacula sp.]
MIAIIDYGMGNVRSVYNAFDFIGEDVEITADPQKIANASRIVLPGVGAFGKAMLNLNERGLVEILHREVLEKGKPFLGICLGMQLLTQSSSEHGFTKGLGWIPGKVRMFDLSNSQLKLPHMGWNDITTKISHPVFDNLREDHFTFFFVHSYHIIIENQKDIAATCEYGYNFTASIARDNIFATQFHPEKSQDNGIQVLENFVKWEC